MKLDFTFATFRKLGGDFYWDCLPMMVVFNTITYFHRTTKLNAEGNRVMTNKSKSAAMMGLLIGVTYPVSYPLLIVYDIIDRPAHEKWCHEQFSNVDEE